MYGQPLINWVTWIAMGGFFGLPLVLALLVAPWAGLLDDLEGWKHPLRSMAGLFVAVVLVAAAITAAVHAGGADILTTVIIGVGTYVTIPVWLGIFKNPNTPLPRSYKERWW